MERQLESIRLGGMMNWRKRIIKISLKLKRFRCSGIIRDALVPFLYSLSSRLAVAIKINYVADKVTCLFRVQ